MVQYSPTVDRAFVALADPTRRAVLERLGTGSATVSELAEPFGMSLTGMKKHIRLLEEAKLVTTEKIGRVRRCALAPYASRASARGCSGSTGSPRSSNARKENDEPDQEEEGFRAEEKAAMERAPRS